MANNESVSTNPRAEAAPGTMLAVGGAAASQVPSWNLSAQTVPTFGAGMHPLVFFHALRRHWVLAAGLGVLCAAAAGLSVYFGIGERYTASAYFQVAMQQAQILPGGENTGTDRDRFEIFKNTQLQYILSPMVLAAAVREQEVAQLPTIKEHAIPGPEEWLERKLSVSFPGRAELMEVSLTLPDPREAATIVNAVVASYLTRLDDMERKPKQTRLEELNLALAEKQNELFERRNKLKRLAMEVGTDEKETLTLKLRLALEELTLYRQELARVQFEVRRAQGELAGQQALLKTINEMEIVDPEVDVLVQSDPVARQLFIELGWRSIERAYNEGRVAPGRLSVYVDRADMEYKSLQEQFEARRKVLTEVVRQKRRQLVQADIVKLETSLQVMREQEAKLAAEVDAKQKITERFGNSAPDVEMLRSDIKNLDAMLANISTERDRLNVEMRNASRVRPLQTTVTPPDIPSNFWSRLALTLFAVLGGACAPAACIIALDVPARRINHPHELSRGLGLPVIGSMPLIPPRAIQRLDSPSKRYRAWQIRLTESIDGIAARILCKSDLEPCRAIMVTSAVGGEGKTTLATQLAMSLARAGRRTVLVDFDLRQPAFDGIFGLPLEPGVCDALRRKNAVPELIHSNVAENLSVITAGRWDRPTLASLSNGSAAALFKQLREEFEFVVVDTSPILPVADARFVSQHVDSVVLAVFRDVSQAPKIQAACEVLEAFGVESVEAVITAPAERGMNRSRGYESAVSS